jgi:hypothetical protein
MKFLSIFIVMCLTFATQAEELRELKKIQSQEVKKINSSIKIKPNLSHLNTLAVSSSTTINPTNESDKQTSSEQRRPIESWPEVSKDTNTRLFPVVSDNKRFFVSIYGDSTTISRSLENEIREATKNSFSNEGFFVHGKLVEKIFQELKFLRGEKLFWFSFHEGKLNSVSLDKIDKLLIKPNEAGGELFGTLGIELSLATNLGQNSNIAIGLGYVGKESPFESYQSGQPTWSTTSAMNLQDDKTIELANFISPVGETGERNITMRTDFQSHQFQNGEFIKGQAAFSRKEFTGQESFAENFLGYFLKINNRILTIYDFYIDSTYYQKPEVIIVGKWLKGYDFSAYISSTGMGDCGKFVLVKGTQANFIPVRCGIWGC